MKRIGARTATVLSGLALFSMSAGPALAQGWGWGDPHYRHHRRGGTDGGEILAGILLIGGIVAIASAASKANENERDRDRDGPDYYPAPAPAASDPVPSEPADVSGDQRPEWREGGGIDAAIERCKGAAGRDAKDEVRIDSANRDGDGWIVRGSTGASGGFSCAVNAQGQITNVNRTASSI